MRAERREAGGRDVWERPTRALEETGKAPVQEMHGEIRVTSIGRIVVSMHEALFSFNFSQPYFQ